MGLSKETRIKIFIVVDVVFFLLEIIVGYAVHSLALVADAFHMLNDVISLCVGLWAVRVASQKSRSNEYTYGWARAELIGGLINGVFLVALCLSIFLDAIQRFFEPQEVQNPEIVLIVGGVGLAFNILGLFVFHQHSHGHEDGDHVQEPAEQNELSQAEHGHHEHIHSFRTSTDTQKSLSPAIPWGIGDPYRQHSVKGSSLHRPSSASRDRSMTRQRDRTRSLVDEFPAHPATLRRNFREYARTLDVESDESIHQPPPTESDAPDPSEATPLLNGLSDRSSRKSRQNLDDDPPTKLDGASIHDSHLHRHRQHNTSDHGGHSHSDMNIRGLFLHVLGDALGNVGVMVSALIIWLTTSPIRYYADPAISLVITIIILKTALPMCKDTAKPLLQATPSHIFVDNIKEDITNLPGVKSCHDVHVWALTPSKPIATLHVELDFNFEGANAAKYMDLAKEIKTCLHGHGIHSSTIQPEFRPGPEQKDVAALQNDRESRSSTSTIQTAIIPTREQNLSPASGACLLGCKDSCTSGQQCCGVSRNNGARTENPALDTAISNTDHTTSR